MRGTLTRRAGPWLAALAMLGVARTARATPYDFVSVTDPINEEFRWLDVLDPSPLGNRILLPHLNTLPYQHIELQGPGAPLTDLDPARRISMIRIERYLGRDRGDGFAEHPQYGSTPRLFQSSHDGERFEIAAGVSGQWSADKHDSRYANESGFDTRIAIGLDRWVAYSRFVVGHFDSTQNFADPVVANSDIVGLTEETYIGYTGERQRWAMQFGQNRWHWGPGSEGSLVLSSSSPSIVGLAMSAHLTSTRLDLIAISGTIAQSAGEQIAAHRVEWQPTKGLRVGVTEAARYHANGWEPLYLLGAIPYVLVQRLYVRSEPESSDVLRNNIITAFDASWRIAPGTRVYSELLLDDLHSRSGKNPDKYGFQLGYDGAGVLGRSRVTWSGEYTRLTRFVYTSFYGRAFVVQGRPLGFPVAPDSRRFRARVSLDLDENWQFTARATHSDKGENDLNEPFIPGSPKVNSAEFEGIVETTRDFELGARYWPASGIDLEAFAGYRWIDNLAHVLDATDRTPIVSIRVSLLR